MPEYITPNDLWKFLQQHKSNTKDEFGSWLIGLKYDTTDKIIKAVYAWNAKERGEK